MDLEAEDALRSLLRTGNPYGSPFQTRVKQRAILFPVLNQLNAQQWNAVHASSSDELIWHAVVGDDDRERYWPEIGLQRVLPIHDFAEYKSAAQLETSALWSPRGEWVILIGQQWFALAGGAHRFLSGLERNWPEWPGGPQRLSESLIAFARSERDVIAEPWLRELLTHVYGSARTDEALREVAKELETSARRSEGTESDG
jgi:hypothetical protein